jgi:hypothetical protein
MKNRRSVLKSLGLALALVSLPALGLAQPGQWELLGQRNVNFRVDRDVIPVTAREGVFRGIELEVSGNNPIEIFSLVVHFGNGADQNVEVRQVIPAGGRTRTIDLPGNTRVIRSIEVVYRTDGRARRGRAAIRLWGKH